MGSLRPLRGVGCGLSSMVLGQLWAASSVLAPFAQWPRSEWDGYWPQQDMYGAALKGRGGARYSSLFTQMHTWSPAAPFHGWAYGSEAWDGKAASPSTPRLKAEAEPTPATTAGKSGAC